jgi:hypothetical protein
MLRDSSDAIGVAPSAVFSSGGEVGSAILDVCLVYLAILLVRAIFFWSWMMPYTSASAVGGQPGT